MQRPAWVLCSRLCLAEGQWRGAGMARSVSEGLRYSQGRWTVPSCTEVVRQHGDGDAEQSERRVSNSYSPGFTYEELAEQLVQQQEGEETSVETTPSAKSPNTQNQVRHVGFDLRRSDDEGSLRSSDEGEQAPARLSVCLPALHCTCAWRRLRASSHQQLRWLAGGDANPQCLLTFAALLASGTRARPAGRGLQL